MYSCDPYNTDVTWGSEVTSVEQALAIQKCFTYADMTKMGWAGTYENSQTAVKNFSPISGLYNTYNRRDWHCELSNGNVYCRHVSGGGEKNPTKTVGNGKAFPIIKLNPEVKLTPGANGTYTLYVEESED